MLPELRLRRWRRRREFEVVVWLPTSLRDELVLKSTEHAPKETGGVILGYESDDGSLVVTRLIDGGPGARRERSLFVPDGAWQEKEIAGAYEASGRSETYLGDWHSHPRGVTTPSSSDQRTAKKIANYVDARMPQPLMIIVADDEDGWRIAAHRYDGKRLRKARMRLCR